MVNKEASTMAVRDMGKLLGLKKTASYYLVHKNVFETVVIAGKLRIVKASFEKWYAYQDKYRKIDGTPPGAALHADLYSIQDIASMLMLSKESTHELVHRQKLKVLTINSKHWISKTDFDNWYASQTRYRNAEDREHDRVAEETSMTVPEMGRLLGLDRKEAWKLYRKERQALELIRIANKPRITMASFTKWYMNQKEYHVMPKVSFGNRATMKEYIRPREAVAMTSINVHSIYSLLRHQKMKGKQIGRAWYIKYVDMLNRL